MNLRRNLVKCWDIWAAFSVFVHIVMHRFVESCSVVICNGSAENENHVKATNNNNKIISWGETGKGTKTILCNNADDAVIISTTVIGIYPTEPNDCRGPLQE